MHGCVTEFELGEEVRLPPPSSAAAHNIGRTARAILIEDELLELLWLKGAPVVQPVLEGREVSPALLEYPAVVLVPAGSNSWAGTTEAVRLFMEEDEIVPWLHYPFGDDEADREAAGQVEAEELAPVVEERVPSPLPSSAEVLPGEDSGVPKGVVVGSGKTSTVVDRSYRSEKPPEEEQKQQQQQHAVASSSRKSNKKKRKAVDGSGEEAAFKSGDKRKDSRRSASTRCSRAAEVHNLSERRRRDRISEKMKALQDLIPRCNKFQSDKASMLDEAAQYVKSLQLQIQMLTMPCNMSPMMVPGMQTYMPPMGMAMGMGLVMRPEMGHGGMGPPMLPFWPVPVPSSANLVTRVPPFKSPNITTVDQSRVQVSKLQDPASNPTNMLVPYMVRIPRRSPASKLCNG